MSELQGQMDIGEIIPIEGTGTAEGYDAEGHLMNYEPGASPQTSADMSPVDRLTALVAEVRTIEEQVRGVALMKPSRTVPPSSIIQNRVWPLRLFPSR